MPLLVFVINLFLFLVLFSPVQAIYDPTQYPNNKIGLHILFPGEVETAAKIVNRDQKAAWGYVTIPIQSTDRNRIKWQQFLDKCKEQKIIPIIRIATAPQNSHWIEPNNFDLVDFANFLNDLHWPTQNRYVIVFNEVNRADEYGGSVSPEDYADILSNAVDVFKSKSSDFFILPAGLDNAAINTKIALSWRTYLERMHRQQPDIFNKIDGWTSHAYPNPEFSARPDISGSNKIDSYVYDLKLVSRFTNKKLPIFITEAGWSNRYLSEHQIALYYQHALSKIWSDPQIVAITPFLLDAQDGPFKQFSFLKENRQPYEFSSTLSNFAINGQPLLAVIPPPVNITPISASTISAQPNQKPVPSLTAIRNLYHEIVSLINSLRKK